MDATEIDGDINDTLAQDAEEFGGGGESTGVTTYHARITSEDLVDIVNGKIIETDSIYFRPPREVIHPSESYKNNDKFAVLLSENTVERLARGEIVSYGIRQINGKNQMLHVSCGGVSDLFDDDRSPLERLKQEEPHLFRKV